VNAILPIDEVLPLLQVVVLPNVYCRQMLTALLSR
jgi:hypothetical protein